MYIKEIVIDGFKSYGRRTEINGFDRSFNAITGLNGSGKSNILDAICFVLGITNLSNVRATSLQELVYKQGQANINKASVTVKFDNRDKTQCPPGYEDVHEITITRQVVIGGKNKYMLNGLQVQVNRIQDFFRSVQMNVNNPHFLIMQGRITKVLNMKPIEILSMVEEAAGTRLYKTKKEQSVKTLEKKDLKMSEINRQLTEELEPKIAKLREERVQYQELLKLKREAEQLSRIHLAFKFFEAERRNEDLEKELTQCNKSIDGTKQAVVDGKKEILELEAVVKQLQEIKNREGNTQLKDAERSLSEAEKKEAVLLARDKESQDNLKAEVRRRQQVIKNIATDEGLLKKKENTLETERGEYSTMEEATTKLKESLENARKRHQAASMGLFVDESGKASTLQQQLIDAQKVMSDSKAETQQLQMKMDPLKTDLKSKKDQLRRTSGNFGQEQGQLETLEKNVAALQKEVEKVQPAVTQQQEASARYETVLKETKRLEDQLNVQLRNFSSAKFEYTDPEPNFNRRLVRGLVCRLFTVNNVEMSNALENVAGGKLYNVITENEEVAKKLLKNKCVANRVTFMPLNKVRPYNLNPSIIKKAQSYAGKDNVWQAIDLISYPDELKPAMQFVFGSTLVCRDLKLAKVLAYMDGVKTKCVTMEGDVVEPGGSMSGGAASKRQPILAVLAGLKDKQNALDKGREELGQLRGQLRNLEGTVHKYQTMQADLDTKNHQISLLKARIEQSAHGRLELEIKDLETEITTSTARLQELKDVERKATQKHKELETKVKQSKELADKEIKSSEKEMKTIQAELDKRRVKWDQCEQNFKTLELEITELKDTIEKAKADVETSVETIKQLEIDVDTCKEELAEASASVREKKSTVQKQKDIISKQNKELQSKKNRIEHLNTQAGEHELTLKKLQTQLNKLTEDSKSASSLVAKMLSNYEWIAQEKRHFNQPGIYDFKTTAPEQVNERVAAIQARVKNLEKRTNTQAMHILTKAEEQLRDLMKKKGLVERDRKQLQMVISELDKKMVDVLQQAWQQINKDFGSIFSTLLKGADAKLVCSSGSNNVLEGLEVKVGFNGKWKDSLGELSGGQRSLVALSLILAMLLFKPAPIYILDEVDAALDPSHTENIGNIIQSHFKQSQFIIVSLKEGMFNNANVLFRTKFVDGMSTVGRQVQKQQKRA